MDPGCPTFRDANEMRKIQSGNGADLSGNTEVNQILYEAEASTRGPNGDLR